MLAIDDLALVVEGASRFLQGLDPDEWTDEHDRMKAAIAHITEFGEEAEKDIPVDKMTKRRGGWIQTHTARRFFPFEPKASEVDPVDISYSLTNTSRFCGHSPFYPVSVHTIRVAEIAAAIAVKRGLEEHEVFLVRAYSLVHDGNEAYGPDVAAPIKEFLPRVREIESLTQNAIHERFLLPPPDPYIEEIVHTADKMALLLEGEELFEEVYHLWKVAEMPLAELDDDIRRAAALPVDWVAGLEEIRARLRPFEQAYTAQLTKLLSILEEKAETYEAPEAQESSGGSSWRDEIQSAPIVDDPHLPGRMPDDLRDEYEDIFGGGQ